LGKRAVAAGWRLPLGSHDLAGSDYAAGLFAATGGVLFGGPATALAAPASFTAPGGLHHVHDLVEMTATRMTAPTMIQFQFGSGARGAAAVRNLVVLKPGTL